MSVWDQVAGQTRAVAQLQGDLAAGRTVHAYLFTGPAGHAPLAFAAALVCPDNGCGTCEWCRRVSRNAHPDVEVIEPAGMQMLIDQIRDVVREAWRHPVAGARRVIVVNGADRMNPNAQNAFLKGLEEAPRSTVIILVAQTADALLETVRSRCREVIFQPLPEAEVTRVLEAEGVRNARLWARVGGGMERARSLASDPDVRERRHELANRLLHPARDPGDALEAAEWLAAQTRVIRDAVAVEQKAIVEQNKDWVKEAKRTSEDRMRREQRRAEQDVLETAMDDATSLLRDLMALAAAPDADVLNDDLRPTIAKRAAHVSVNHVLECLAEVQDARRRLRANANVLLALEHLFLRVHARLG